MATSAPAASTFVPLSYDVDAVPPPLQVVLLGVQYAVMLAIYLILIVIVFRAAQADEEVTRSAISLGMIAAAIATVLQALRSGPVGSGFLAPPVYSAIYLGPSIQAAAVGGLPAVFGMTIFAGLVEVALSFVLQRLRIIIQPTISGLAITVVGLQLGLVGMEHSLGISSSGSVYSAGHVTVAAATLAVCIGLTIWGRGVWRLVSSLGGLVAGVVTATLLGLPGPGGMGGIATASWAALPGIDHIRFAFEPALIPAFVAAGLAGALRVVGVVTTCQRANDPAWKAPDFPNIRKGVLADGLGCAVGGALGTPGMNIGPSLVGISIATGVTSRVIAYACAAVLVVLAFTPKVAGAILDLPTAVAGALLVFTASIMIGSGLQLITSRTLDTRAVFVVGLGLLLPLTRQLSPGFFDRLPAYLHLVAESGLALSLAAACALTLVFRIATPQSETINWRESDKALADLARTLNANATEWQLGPALIARTLTGVEQAFRLLKEGHYLHKPLAVVATHRKDGLDIEIRYDGVALTIPTLRSVISAENEEAPATAGLQRLSIGVFPDHAATRSQGGHISISLGFNG
ncbi:MAG TPA: solute carrier family 23 protein [Geminicoccus sp.]|uniref:solute carrier family 23 protein n=1 Tax=Geminicoccus sp. TaxID=2024832 RepID=UPI002C8ABEE9|nr:solute carrier family 23 protein [Geminicoccus sp.]HWL69763.1 solute carrier family 23 protein [Geminicoccus sp.]